MPQTAQTISSAAVTKVVKTTQSDAINIDSNLSGDEIDVISENGSQNNQSSADLDRVNKQVRRSMDKSENSASDSPSSKPQANPQLTSVMSDLSQLSQSFVNSYQSLEGQVEQLNGQLQNASEQRSEAIEEKQKLIDEKQTITNRLQNLLAILPSGVVVLDGKGVVRDCNAVAIDILGRPLLGETWFDVISRAFMPQADDGHQISLRDGRKVHIETRALDSEPGQMIVLTDMTKTRELQTKLSQQQKLSSMGKMIASLAHQIRTPLSAAILYGSHLNSNQLSKDKQQSFAGHLMERLRFMDRQISDMLNFVKGERKEKHLVAVESIIEQIKSLGQTWDHKLEFKLSGEILNSETLDTKASNRDFLLSDSDSLLGALSNLIENAIDATSNEQPVSVEIAITKNYRLKIAVKDLGSGVDDQLKQKIFEPFYSSKNNGNGLGLAIVQGVIIEHQGQISVRDNVKEGSVFEIELPLFSESGKLKNSRAVTKCSQSEDNQSKNKHLNDDGSIDDRLVLQGAAYGH